MIFFERKKLENTREIYLFGRKIFSYKKYNLGYGTVDYNTLPVLNEYETDNHKYPKISIIYPVYYTHKNIENFTNLILKYNDFHDKIKGQFEIIIVDDCSKYPLKLPTVNLNITLLRILKDIPWNNSGARNLGACYAITPKLILMDEDWFMPEATLQAFIDIKLNKNDFLPLLRVYGGKKNVCPNLFCTNKHTFFNFNCYDEDWCGIYGEDIFYRRYITANNANFKVINKHIIPSSKLIKNHSHNLSRNVNKTREKLSKLKKLEHKKEILNFPWEFVESYTFKDSKALYCDGATERERESKYSPQMAA